MQLWRLASSTYSELLSQLESEGQQAAVETRKANVPAQRLKSGRILS